LKSNLKKIGTHSVASLLESSTLNGKCGVDVSLGVILQSLIVTGQSAGGNLT